MLSLMILNAVVLDSVNKSAPTQLVRTTVPVAVTTILLMTYTTAWVCDTKGSYLTESSHIIFSVRHKVACLLGW